MKKIEFNAQREMSAREREKNGKWMQKASTSFKTFQSRLNGSHKWFQNGKYPLAKWVGVGAFNPEVNK